MACISPSHPKTPTWLLGHGYLVVAFTVQWLNDPQECPYIYIYIYIHMIHAYKDYIYNIWWKMPQNLLATPRCPSLHSRNLHRWEKNITQTTKIYGVNFPCLRMAFIRRVMRCTARTIQRPKLLPNLWHVIRLRVLLHGFLENVPLNVP